MYQRIFFGFIIFILALLCGELKAQNCQLYEQTAFNYFVTTLIRQDEQLINKKFVFDRKIEQKYTDFDFGGFIKSSDNATSLDKSVRDTVMFAAHYAEYDGKKLSYCSAINVPDSLTTFSKKKHKHKYMKLLVFKATSCERYHYVKIRALDNEHWSDFIIEIGNDYEVKRWFKLGVIF